MVRPSGASRCEHDAAEISTLLTGTGNISHLDANAAALERGPLPEADRAKLFRLLSDSWSPD